MESLPKVVIVDLGSQYTLLIERTLRELGVRSVVLEPKRAGKWLASNPVNGIILSGGPAGVCETNAPQPPREIFSQGHPNGGPIPILGICYGMQWFAQHLGGQVTPAQSNREYGETRITVKQTSIFLGTNSRQMVWASHGDSVTRLPAEFEMLAHSDSGAIAAMVNEDRTIWGVQFHPEVTHTKFGQTILGNFVRAICGCEVDWQPSDMIEEISRETLDRIEDGRAIFGFSGGVDSTTVGAILSPALGERLLGVTIDAGHLRENELDEIKRHAEVAGIQHRVIQAAVDFGRIADTTDAEEKRRRFKQAYTRVLKRAAEEFGANFIIQGTLAPDRIESGTTGGALIKSHHNVGLDFGHLTQIHPIDHLFKYEVRALARELGLPESVYSRQPFPGSGLFLRVVGVSATPDRLNLVRWADARVREILERHHAYQDISQLVVGLNGVNTVGVKGDGRAYGPSIIVRAVKTLDFMTAEGVRFPSAIKDEIEAVLCQHREIVRVWYDEMKKPPATTELE